MLATGIFIRNTPVGYHPIAGTYLRWLKFSYWGLSFLSYFYSPFGSMVSGVSVQDMLLRLPFLTPET
jgi:hypothetical protein